MKKSHIEKLISAFESGQSFTAAQAEKRLGVPRTSVTKRVSDLRSMGYCVYANRAKGSNEVTYRLGTPSKAIIAAGFQAMRQAGASL